MTLWMEVTLDEYELPVAVAGTARELAKLRNTTAMSIITSISKHRHGVIKRCKYVKVTVNDNED